MSEYVRPSAAVMRHCAICGPPGRDGTARKGWSGVSAQRDLARSLDDLADGVDLLAAAGELVGDGLGEGGLHDDAVADAHVEDAAHLVLGDVAVLLEELEDGEDGPGGGVDAGVDFVVQGADEVVGESAAGDVGHAGDDLLHAVLPHGADDGVGVDAGGCEEDLGEVVVAYIPTNLGLRDYHFHNTHRT